MGVVYRALDQRLDRTVALKLLPAEAVFSAERKQRLIREAKAASALNNPHIVTIYQVGQDRSGGVERDYIAMEHVEGGSLDSLLKTKPLGTGEALGLALQLADALAAAHEAGIVHRDVKPANILLTKKGDVKLAGLRPRQADRTASAGRERPHDSRTSRPRPARSSAPRPTCPRSRRKGQAGRLPLRPLLLRYRSSTRCSPVTGRSRATPTSRRAWPPGD